MASRVMYVGDTYPSVFLQVSDETGVLNLATASSILVMFKGATYLFSGAGAAHTPSIADPDGVHFWNCSYAFATGDTANVDTYVPYVVVTWTTGNVETFATTDTLTVLAAP